MFVNPVNINASSGLDRQGRSSPDNLSAGGPSFSSSFSSLYEAVNMVVCDNAKNEQLNFSKACSAEKKSSKTIQDLEEDDLDKSLQKILKLAEQFTG